MPEFHSLNLSDPGRDLWSPIVDRILAEPSAYAVVQASADPGAPGPHNPSGAAAVGLPASKLCLRVSTRWDYAPGLNDAEIAGALARRINALLGISSGQLVAVDEVSAGTGGFPSVDYCSLALDQITDPSRVHWYLVNGPGVSWANLDADGDFPFITGALEAGSGILAEVYMEQGRAERSGDVREWIFRRLRGPADGQLPYLLSRARALRVPVTESRISVVLSPNLKYAQRLKPRQPLRLPWGRWMDLCFHVLFRRFPKLASNGVSTYLWETARNLPPSRSVGGLVGPSAPVRAPAAVFADLLDHYGTAQGKRFFKPLG